VPNIYGYFEFVSNLNSFHLIQKVEYYPSNFSTVFLTSSNIKMPSPPSIHQRQNNNKSTPSHANTNNNANANIPPTSSPAFATFPTNNQQLPSLQQFPSNSIQTNLLLNSLLLRHLQLNGQQNATDHHQSSSTQSMLPPMFWPNNDFFSPNSQQQPPQPPQSQPTLTGPFAAGSTAIFTKNGKILWR
jgi:hypothetical protein